LTAPVEDTIAQSSVTKTARERGRKRVVGAKRAARSHIRYVARFSVRLFCACAWNDHRDARRFDNGVAGVVDA